MSNSVAMAESPIYIERVFGGWVTWRFKGIKIIGSYIHDMPIEWLTAIYSSLTNHIPLCVTLDNEDDLITIVSNQQETILYIPDSMFVKCELNVKTIIPIIYHELCKYKKDWLRWLSGSDDLSEDKIIERHQKLDDLYDKIDAVLLLKAIK